MKKAFNVQIGMRLFIASLVLFLSGGSVLGFVISAIVMTFPSWKYIAGRLAIGAGGESEEDKKKFLDELTKQMKDLIADSTKDTAKKEDIEKKIEAFNKSVADLDNAQKKALKEAADKFAEENKKMEELLEKANETLNKQALEIKAIKDNAGVAKRNAPKTFIESVREAIVKLNETTNDKFLTEKDDSDGKRVSLSDYFQKNPKGLLSIKIERPVDTINKTLVDMFESSIVGADVNELRLTTLDPSRVGIPLTIYPHVTDIFMSKRMKSKFMALMVVYEYEDGAGTKAEGSASVKSSFKLKTVAFPAFVIATHFVTSDETLDDLDEVLDEIRVTTPDKLLDEIDSQILGASGDDSSAIAGILTANKHTAFSNTLYLNSIEGANFLDVVACMKSQVNKAKYKANVVLLNPTDVMFLAAAKNTFEDSREDRRVQYDNLGNPIMFYGLRIIQSEAIGIGEAIVMDREQAWIGRKWDIILEIGYNGTDFVEGQKTIVLKTRLAFGVKDKAAIVYSDDVNAEVANITKTS